MLEIQHNGIVSVSIYIIHAHAHVNLYSKPFRSTYYDERMRASPALLRARAPYLLKNTVLGFTHMWPRHRNLYAALVLHTHRCLKLILVDSYTINVISQDEFDDVIVPDEPLKSSIQQPLGTTQAVQQALDARK